MAYRVERGSIVSNDRGTNFQTPGLPAETDQVETDTEATRGKLAMNRFQVFGLLSYLVMCLLVTLSIKERHYFIAAVQLSLMLTGAYLIYRINTRCVDRDDSK